MLRAFIDVVHVGPLTAHQHRRKAGVDDKGYTKVAQPSM
jgi:hypothetical protein